MDSEEEQKMDTGRLVQSEQSLGDHVTGGVFLEWTHVQQRLRELQLQSVWFSSRKYKKLFL